MFHVRFCVCFFLLLKCLESTRSAVDLETSARVILPRVVTTLVAYVRAGLAAFEGST